MSLLLLFQTPAGTTFQQTVSASGVGTLALTPGFIGVASISATAVGTMTMTRLVTFGQLISATALGTLSLTRIVTYLRTIAATAVGTLSLVTDATVAGGLRALLSAVGGSRRRGRR